MLRSAILDSTIATMPSPIVQQLPSLSCIVSSSVMSDVQDTRYHSPKTSTINSFVLQTNGLSLSPRNEIRHLPSLRAVLGHERLYPTLRAIGIPKSEEMFVSDIFSGNASLEIKKAPILKPDHISRKRGKLGEKRLQRIKFCGIHSCMKRAKMGGLCIAHGGGLRCSNEGCCKHAVTLGLCISHGGGKRCAIAGCYNASRKKGVCWSHGGRRLCKYANCAK